jgi:hypothetical protein
MISVPEEPTMKPLQPVRYACYECMIVFDLTVGRVVKYQHLPIAMLSSHGIGRYLSEDRLVHRPRHISEAEVAA